MDVVATVVVKIDVDTEVLTDVESDVVVEVDVVVVVGTALTVIMEFCDVAESPFLSYANSTTLNVPTEMNVMVLPEIE